MYVQHYFSRCKDNTKTHLSPKISRIFFKFIPFYLHISIFLLTFADGYKIAVVCSFERTSSLTLGGEPFLWAESMCAVRGVTIYDRHP